MKELEGKEERGRGIGRQEAGRNEGKPRNRTFVREERGEGKRKETRERGRKGNREGK